MCRLMFLGYGSAVRNRLCEEVGIEEEWERERER